MASRWLRGCVIGGVVLGAGCLLGAAHFDALVLQALTPREPFAAGAVPRAPDYADAAAWSALPGREDVADAAVPQLPARDQATAPRSSGTGC